MNYFKVEDPKLITGIIDRFNALAAPVALDLETTGLDRFSDTVICAVLASTLEETAHWIPTRHLHLLSYLTCPVVLHNFKFDYAFLKQLGIDLKHLHMRDTMLLHHLLDENASHALDDIIQDKWQDPYKEVFWKAHKSFQEATTQAQLEYACKDVIYTVKLYNYLCTEFKEKSIPDSLVDHVHKLALALYSTEEIGVRVDLDYLGKVGATLSRNIKGYKDIMRPLAPEVELVELAEWDRAMNKLKTPKGRLGVIRPEFNWDSHLQLKQLIYSELRLPEQKKKSKATGRMELSVDDDALAAIESAHPLIPALRSYRDDKKIFGSFIEGTLERQVGGRIYPSFNVNGTVTGRISSSNPNLQQLPREGNIRGIYVPDIGHKIICCDYGMLEVVVAAHFSKDPNLLKIIYDGASKHDITAAELGIERQTAKTINFAMGYGATKYKIKDILNCSLRDAELALAQYWRAYAGEKRVIEQCQRKVDRGEDIIGLFGRRRRFPRTFEHQWQKEGAYRQAYSSLIQGSGADLTHRAFYQVHSLLGQRGVGNTLFEVHDEIVIQAREDNCDEAIDILKTTMVHSGDEVGFSLPLTVDCSQPLSRWEK